MKYIEKWVFMLIRGAQFVIFYKNVHFFQDFVFVSHLQVICLVHVLYLVDLDWNFIVFTVSIEEI